MRLEERIHLHRQFWNGQELDAPLFAFRVGDYFLSNKFSANLPLLKPKTVVTPQDIPVDSYLAEFEAQYLQCERIGQTGFFSAEPFTGFPWMEAMLGCPVLGAEVAFVTHPVYSSISDLGSLSVDPANPWFRKYMEFLDKLTACSAGRFPVGQPILRGASDVVSALVGQEEMACALIEEPELLKDIFLAVSRCQRQLLEEHYRHIEPYCGGYTSGFYYLWSPGRFLWYQEDMSALMSPRHFGDFLDDPGRLLCEGCDYTMIHLHPSSFAHLDYILANPALRVVQINKDVGGPGVRDMLPEYLRVLEAGKKLVVWGDLDENDLVFAMEHLPRRDVVYSIFAPTEEIAKDLAALCRRLW